MRKCFGKPNHRLFSFLFFCFFIFLLNPKLKTKQKSLKMIIRNQWLHRIAAFSLAVFGLYVFLSGVNADEYKVLDDGSLIDASQIHLMCFKNAKTILTFRAGFDVYRSICYGLSSFFLLVDLLLNSGHLTLPALVLAAGEIVNDFSDFCLAIAIIFIYIGGIPAAVYGITYLSLLMLEVVIWLGTCKFHETCRLANFESQLIRKKQEEGNQGVKKVS